MRSARCLLRVYICRCSLGHEVYINSKASAMSLAVFMRKGKNIVIDLRGRSTSVSENDKLEVKLFGKRKLSLN